MTTAILLPSRFDIQTMSSFTRQVVSDEGEPRDNSFIFNFSSLYWIDGVGITVFCNTIKWLLARGVACAFSGHLAPHSDALLYLDDCGFFEEHLKERLRPVARVRATTLPLTMVRQVDSYDWIERKFTPWMSNALLTPPATLHCVKTCVAELFQNIKDHSTLESGYIHLQHYPKRDEVKITVSDFGVGIPHRMKMAFGDMSDGEAIRKATLHGVTTRSRENNGGVGLNYLIETVGANDGTVRIHSQRGAVFARKDDGKTTAHVILGNGNYPGTLVDVMLRTDRFVGDENEERGEVEW